MANKILNKNFIQIQKKLIQLAEITIMDIVDTENEVPPVVASFSVENITMKNFPLSFSYANCNFTFDFNK